MAHPKSKSSAELYWNAVTNDIDGVRESLTTEGVNVNSTSNADVRTVLMHAAIHGNCDMITALHDAAADINRKSANHGMTALAFAIANGHCDACRLLLSLGAEWDSNTASLIVGRLRYGLVQFENTHSDHWPTVFCSEVFDCFMVLRDYISQRVCTPTHHAGCSTCSAICRLQNPPPHQQWWLNEVFTNYPALISFKVPHGDAEYLYADPEYMYELFYGWLNLFYEFPKGDQLASIEIQMELQELLDTWATRDLAPRLQALTLALAGTHQGIPSDPKVPLMARGEGGLRQKKLGVLVPGPSQDRKEEKEREPQR
jgi:hypothetical protein